MDKKTLLAQTLGLADITDITTIQFIPNQGSSFSTDRENIKRIAIAITSQTGKVEFAPEELRSSYDFVVANLISDAPLGEQDELKELLKNFVHTGGQISIVRELSKNHIPPWITIFMNLMILGFAWAIWTLSDPFIMPYFRGNFIWEVLWAISILFMASGGVYMLVNWLFAKNIGHIGIGDYIKTSIKLTLSVGIIGFGAVWVLCGGIVTFPTSGFLSGPGNPFLIPGYFAGIVCFLFLLVFLWRTKKIPSIWSKILAYSFFIVIGTIILGVIFRWFTGII